MIEIQQQPPDPSTLKSKRFYSEEKYHYLDNLDKIESELKEFKLDIEKKFKYAQTKDFKFARQSNDSFDSNKTPLTSH